MDGEGGERGSTRPVLSVVPALTPDPRATAEAGPRLSVAAVARRLGVAPATLRTWARRYGLEPSDHTAGAHRRYTPVDVARLETMRRLTLQGVAPAEAAAVALDEQAPAPAAAQAPADDVVEALNRAAMALDSRTVLTALRAQIIARGVIATWDDVLRPVLATAGAHWAATGEGVEVEHLLSDCVATVLREVSVDAAEPGRPVLLACAPGEQHSLPLHALAAGLAERGVGARVLGAAMPVRALEASVRRTRPAVVFLWSQLPGTADPGVLQALPRATRPGTVVVVGGPGWGSEPLPSPTERAADLPHAVDLVALALGA